MEVLSPLLLLRLRLTSVYTKRCGFGLAQHHPAVLTRGGGKVTGLIMRGRGRASEIAYPFRLMRYQDTLSAHVRSQT